MAKKATKIDSTDERQGELEAENMPKSSPIGKAAKAYLAACDELDSATEELSEAKKEAKKNVLDLMTQEGRESVIVDGITFTMVHKEATDEIRVYNKKKSKAIQNDEE